METSAPESPAGAGSPERVLGGRYELEDAIGRGGTAVVYRARDRRTGRAVAVKLFAPAGDGGPGRRREREMQLLSALDHPGLVAVLDTGVEHGTDGLVRPFLVMQLVEGTTLSARRAQGAMAPAQVTRIGRELAQALAHVHSHGITHRDVTPANVLLDAAGRARLTDFGIALLTDQTRITATGAVIGTAAYMSPEQVCGDPVGPPTDVYALGLVLLEAATGRVAYSGTGREVAVARLTRRPEIPPELTGALGRLLPWMTAHRPDDRPTAAEVASALNDDDPRTMMVLLPPPAEPGTGTRRTRTSIGPAVAMPAGTASAARSRRLPGLAAAGLLAVAGLAVAGVWSFSGPAAEDGGGGLAPVGAPPVAAVLPAPRVDPTPVHATVVDPSTAQATRRPAVPAADRDRTADAPRRAAPQGRGAAPPGDGNGDGKRGNGNGNGGRGKGKGHGNAGKGDGGND